MRLLYTLLLLFVLGSVALPAQLLRAELAFPRLDFALPLDLQHPPGDDSRLFVVSQVGWIHSFPNRADASASTLFLDIRDSTAAVGECGLLGMAFDPGYRENGWFYCYYASPQKSTISRFSVDPQNPDSAIRSSEKIILTIPQFGESNHKGGQIAFGPDGYLYIAPGDGGGANDPYRSGQDLKSLLGKVIRIDVHDTSGGGAYAIPVDNPFADATDGRRREIFAYGFRNPWRFSFDPVTGRLWVGDVGQDRYEEIDVVTNGGNYGWSTMEGDRCFNPATGCDTTGLTMPVWVYSHAGPDSMTGVSVIGGRVYRGTRFPELVGKYIYGDIGSGNIWALDYRPEGGTTNRLILSSDLSMTSFGVDAQGEIYLTVYGGTGRIYQLVAPPSRVTGDRSVDAATLLESRAIVRPGGAEVVIAYTLGRRSALKLTISDALGREILVVVDEERPAGDFRESVDLGRLARGVYYYTLSAGEERQTGRFVIR